jgi:peptidoglycan/xylan/chitin deacetylase (PgdA/CDA1 family)
LDYPTFEAYAKGEKALSAPAFLLSFDDGLRECHDVIAPILLRKGVPAICFLNSAFIDNQGLFFRYQASLLHVHSQRDPTVKAAWLALLAQKGQAPRSLLSIRYHERAWLGELAEVIGYSFTDYLRQQRPYLTTPQIRSLIDQGFYVGGHSIDHPMYQDLSLSEQMHQTLTSVRAVSEQFDLPYRTFSFPFTDYGVSGAFFDQLAQSQEGTLTFGCAGLKADPVATHFQRIPFEVAGLSGRAILHAEWLYTWLTQRWGQHRIHRP